MSETQSPFGNNQGEVLPSPTPEAQELLDVLNHAAAGQGKKELKHQYAAPVDNEQGVPILQTASVIARKDLPHSGPYRSSAVASVNNGRPDVKHGDMQLNVVAGGTHTETNLYFDPKTGRFGEYTTSRGDPFATPEVRTNTMREGMTPRRTQAAARLARLKFGIEMPSDPSSPENADHASDQE